MEYTVAFILLISWPCFNTDFLQDFNQEFRNKYAQARMTKISRTEPLIICNGDNVTIIHRGKRFEEQVIPKLYHDLKSISHIPLTIYLKLMFTQGNLSKELSNELKEYSQSIRSIRQSIRFSMDIEENQYDIIDLSLSFLRNILQSNYIDQNQLKEFCQQMQTYLTININLAARAQLDMLYDKIEPWYHKRFNGTERQLMKIIIIGPKTVRHGHIEKVFFFTLLGEHFEGKHITYVENVEDEDKALEVLGTWYLDEDASTNFFGDPQRLHRDLLSDAAKMYVEELFRKKTSENDTNNVLIDE